MLARLLADSPVVFVEKNSADNTKRIAIVSSKSAKIVAVTMSVSSSNAAHRVELSDYLIRELGGESHVEISFFDEGLFVYGTLLPKYVVPSGGMVYDGWGGLKEVPWVRAIVNGYRLLYDGLPYAVRSRSRSLLGVIYFGIPEESERYIDHVELNAGYTKTTTVGTVVENFPYLPVLKVRMYEYPKARGRSLYTLLFGEFFVADNFRSWYRRERYYEFLIGNSGLIITAPHGGLLRLPRVRHKQIRYADENTFELAKLTVNKIYEESNYRIVPNALIARVHRSILDLNRSSALKHPIGRKYHNTLRNLISGNNKKILLVDIHGMLDRENHDIEIGTLYGYTVHGNVELVETIRKIIERHGLKVAIDIELTGQFTVINSSKIDRVYAIQLELSRKLRLRKNLEKTSKILAKAILAGYNYLTK